MRVIALRHRELAEHRVVEAELVLVAVADEAERRRRSESGRAAASIPPGSAAAAGWFRRPACRRKDKTLWCRGRRRWRRTARASAPVGEQPPMSTVWQKSSSSASWSAVACDQKQLPAPVIDEDRTGRRSRLSRSRCWSSSVSRISAPSSQTSRCRFSRRSWSRQSRRSRCPMPWPPILSDSG